MIRRPQGQADVAAARLCGGMRPALTGDAQKPNPRGMLRAAPAAISKFPPRPNPNILSASIPLFFIGRDRHGFWVAREAEGRSGGLFLLKRSALRFAEAKSKPAGCATMFLAGPLELDVEIQGSRIVASLAAAVDVAARRTPMLVAFIIGSMAEEWWKLIAQISHAFAGERCHREAIEKKLFRGQSTLCAKNDDDAIISQ